MIEAITVADAAGILKNAGLSICATTLRDGLEQGAFPFGVCVRTDRSREFYISRKKLNQFIQDWSAETDHAT